MLSVFGSFLVQKKTLSQNAHKILCKLNTENQMILDSGIDVCTLSKIKLPLDFFICVCHQLLIQNIKRCIVFKIKEIFIFIPNSILFYFTQMLFYNFSTHSYISMKRLYGGFIAQFSMSILGWYISIYVGMSIISIFRFKNYFIFFFFLLLNNLKIGSKYIYYTRLT